MSPRSASRYPVRSLIAIPLIADQKNLGTAVVGFKEFHPFSPQELSLAEQVAGQVALAVAKAGALDTERQRSQELSRSGRLITALSEVATRLAATTDPDKIIETVGVELKRLGVTCLLAMVTPDTRTLSIQYTSIEPHSLTLIEEIDRAQDAGLPHQCGEPGCRTDPQPEQATVLSRAHSADGGRSRPHTPPGALESRPPGWTHRRDLT